MKPFEGSARAIGWVRDDERHPNTGWSCGVVHPEGWWAPDWQEALRRSLEQRRAKDEQDISEAFFEKLAEK